MKKNIKKGIFYKKYRGNIKNIKKNYADENEKVNENPSEYGQGRS
jgi:hypothetical protein